ncbi:hypothetical protein B0A48_12289 [Cryoendolithus antarcticus]|uniref:Uncharacterized protein n=1 Tax=Cryoendolithus antarcticus TaxID=1507870 RepID=A0A1V8SRN2_9PEZI|nr:hypothetical protein B0A48_12289 [Cryoendolithus antarcticus]
MASKGNKIESWEANPWTPAPNANVANTETMTSPEAQAARARSAEIMAALKKGEPGEADKMMGQKKNHDSLLPGMGKLKDKLLGGKKGGE